MSSSTLPTDVGDPISQANIADDVGAGPINRGNSSMPVNNSTDGSASSVLTGNVDASGSTPLLYFLLFVWVVWVLFFVIWIPLLVTRNRRVSRWRRSQRQTRNNNTNPNSNSNNNNNSQDVNENLNHQRGYKYQQQRESIFQMSMMLLLILGSAIGLALSIYTNLSCDFIQLDESMILEWRIGDEAKDLDTVVAQGGDAIIKTGEVLKLEFYSLGLWALGLSSSKSDFLRGGSGYQETCFNVSSSDIWDLGWQFQLARAASVSASVLGGLSLLYLFTGYCNPSQRGYFHYLTLPFLLATILQSLTLFLLDTSYCTVLGKGNNCELGLGAVASISASLYWLFGTLASITPFPPIESTFAPVSTHDEETDQQQ